MKKLDNFGIKNPVHLVLIFLILVVSDLAIGFYGHYVASTDADFSIEAFMEYLTIVDYGHLFLVFLVAIVICLIVFFLGG